MVVDPQGLGRHQRHRGARAADVGAARGDDNRAVLVDLYAGARLAAAVEPIARSDAAPLVRAERRPVGRVVDQRLEGFGIAAMAELWSENHRSPGPGGVLQP